MKEPQPPTMPSLPDVKYFDRATEQVGHFDRLLVTLYSGLIAGIALLLFKQPFCPWVGGLLVLALALFVFGIGHSLIHIMFHNKMLLLLEALVNGTEHVPNMIEQEEATPGAYVRAKDRAQRAYLGQLLYLFLGVVASAAAVVLHLWTYSLRAAIVVAVGIGLVLGILVALSLWRRAAA